MTAPGRLAAALAVVAVSVALPFARATAARTSISSNVTASFSAMGLSFRYPATWQRDPGSEGVASFAAPIVSLSTGQQRDPCTNVTDRTVTCADPIGQLAPGGVLVSWDADGFPTFHVPTPNAKFGGRPAAEIKASGGAWCASLGGTETITVMIPRDLPDNWYQMNACLRVPGLPQHEAQISAMLRTVHLAGGD